MQSCIKSEEYCDYRKQKLLEECIYAYVHTSASSKGPLNILVIGPPGCGKSSFLNTVFASFNDDKWREIARSGRYSDNRQVTRLFKSFTKERYYKGEYSGSLPTFIDITGLEDDDSQRAQKLLNIILSGKILENEPVADIIRDLSKPRWILKFISELKYQRRSVYRRIDRIIVVCSCNPLSSLPSSLLKSITLCADKRDIKVFGVLTHSDQVTTENIDTKTIQKREKKFKELLGVDGSRFARITNYCPDLDHERRYEDIIDPAVNINVLTLMRQVILREENDDIEKHQEEDLFSYISIEALFSIIVVLGLLIGMLAGNGLLLIFILSVVGFIYWEWNYRMEHYL